MPFRVGSYVFSCDFDSGNLRRVVEAENGEFLLWVNSDAFDTEYEKRNSTWFFFTVSGGSKGAALKLRIVNLNSQFKLFSGGHTVIFKTTAASRDWSRLETPLEIRNCPFHVAWTYEFSEADEVVSFAFSYPYPYELVQSRLEDLEQRYHSSSSIYFHREVLVNSLQGRPIDLLTISSFRGHSGVKELAFDRSLFPTGPANRSVTFVGKPYVFVSARVHPGETPGQFLLDGFLDFLLSESDPRAQILRDKLVFLVVPVLNPDGVYLGFYRTDTCGVNLNRMYSNPSRHEHPSIYAVKELLRYHSSQSQLFLYLDFHAHASIRGSFVFGNHLQSIDDQVKNMMFISPSFSWVVGLVLRPAFLDCSLWSLASGGSQQPLLRVQALHIHRFRHWLLSSSLLGLVSFPSPAMATRDPNDSDVSKEGCGRVAVFRCTNAVHCYTLEANYSLPPEPLPPSAVSRGGQLDAEPWLSPRKWRQIGEASAVSILDLLGSNPQPRISWSRFRSLEGIQRDIRIAIRHDPDYSPQFSQQKQGMESRFNSRRKRGGSSLLREPLPMKTVPIQFFSGKEGPAHTPGAPPSANSPLRIGGSRRRKRSATAGPMVRLERSPASVQPWARRNEGFLPQI